jgi:hypothetical protein
MQLSVTTCALDHNDNHFVLCIICLPTMSMSIYLYCYLHPCWLFDLPLPKAAVPRTRAVAEWQPVNHTATNDGGLENDVSGGACDRDDTEYNMQNQGLPASTHLQQPGF